MPAPHQCAYIYIIIIIIIGPMRQVQDKSYHLGILRYYYCYYCYCYYYCCSGITIRSKIGELNNEIIKLSKDLEQLQLESATYTTYEKRYCILAVV